MDPYSQPNTVQDKTPVAQAVTIDNRIVTVSKVRYALPINGLKNNEGFVVDVGANTETGALTRGFSSEDDALQFLSTFGEYETEDLDFQGNARKITVTGLGIPDGMIRKQSPAPKSLQADMPSAASDAQRLAVVDETSAGQRAESARIRELEKELAQFRSERATGSPRDENSAYGDSTKTAHSDDSGPSQRVPFSDPRGSETGGPRDLLSSGESR